MPSVKMPKKSTDTDMAPFVDIAFLLLTFFIMATKFKPSEAVEITTPNSVSAGVLPANDAALIMIAPDNKVFFSILAETEPELAERVIQGVSDLKRLNLTPAEVANFRTANTAGIGMPFAGLKNFLSGDPKEFGSITQPGIPVLDSTNNELQTWIASALAVYSGKKLSFLIKGDNGSTYPAFEAVINALKKNEQNKYNLVTLPTEAPAGSELRKARLEGKK